MRSCKLFPGTALTWTERLPAPDTSFNIVEPHAGHYKTLEFGTI